MDQEATMHIFLEKEWKRKQNGLETDFLRKKNNACEKHMDFYNLITLAFF